MPIPFFSKKASFARQVAANRQPLSRFCVLTISLLLMLFWLPACGQSFAEEIIDIWDVAGKNHTMEFQADGTLLVTETDTNQLYAGDYTFTDANHITLHMEEAVVFGRSEIQAEIDIRGNQMVMTGHFSPASPAPTVLVLTRL
jgi:hypothetical protein